MAALISIVDLVHPSDEATGIFISDTVWVLFDQEIDPDSITNGNFFVTGPDTDSFFGPDGGLNLPDVSGSTSEDSLESPAYQGLVKGVISFEKIQVASLDPYSGFDTSGVSTAWRTKAVFTPTYPLSANTLYKVFLVGDEDITDTSLTGVKTRTIFDTYKGSNLGDGEVVFNGSYTGNAVQDTYTIKCTVAGAAGTAKFTWWKSTDPLNIRGPFKSHRFSRVLVEKGVYATFDDGTYQVDDQFSVLVKKATVYSGNINWSFTTGSGSVTTLPTTTSTTVLGTEPSTGSTAVSPTLTVSSITPKDKKLSVLTTTNQISLVFANDIDPDTVLADSITIMGQPANGDETLFATREIFKNITVSGNIILLDI